MPSLMRKTGQTLAATRPIKRPETIARSQTGNLAHKPRGDSRATDDMANTPSCCGEEVRAGPTKSVWERIWESLGNPWRPKKGGKIMVCGAGSLPQSPFQPKMRLSIPGWDPKQHDAVDRRDTSCPDRLAHASVALRAAHLRGR